LNPSADFSYTKTVVNYKIPNQQYLISIASIPDPQSVSIKLIDDKPDTSTYSGVASFKATTIPTIKIVTAKLLGDMGTFTIYGKDKETGADDEVVIKIFHKKYLRSYVTKQVNAVYKQNEADLEQSIDYVDKKINSLNKLLIGGRGTGAATTTRLALALDVPLAVIILALEVIGIQTLIANSKANYENVKKDLEELGKIENEDIRTESLLLIKPLPEKL